jgi:hypothetical protein
MNIAELQQLIPAEFEYEYLTPSGEQKTEIIKVGLKRVSFKIGAQKIFSEAMAKLNQDPMPLAELLAELVGEWSLDMNGEAFPPSLDNICAAPMDFVGSLAQCAMEKLFANPTKAADSPNGSEPAAALNPQSATTS